jgi:acetyl-CoA synthetase
MLQHAIYDIKTNIAKRTHINPEKYQQLYQQSLNDPQQFWQQQAKEFLHVFQPWHSVLSGNFDNVRWFDGAKLNVAYNCLDKHLTIRGQQTAILWESDDGKQQQSFTYQQLHQQVCRCANALKQLGAKTGDRICIYLPMLPEAVIAMLACARIGAIHTVVFAGFSAQALANRILDADCQIVITADESIRGGKLSALKQNCDEALAQCPKVKSVIVVKRTGANINWQTTRDHWYHEVTQQVTDTCPAEEMDAEHPLFILYTSGSTGKPKGVLHTSAGYLLYACSTYKYVFDYQEQEIYWCTADVGWITGHSYIVYGPLANGATIFMYEGTPNYPTPSRCWQLIDQYKINIFYTAPTTIRTLLGAGDNFVQNTNRSSLRILGSVGEPINPEVWQWYYTVVGKQNCPIVDTWWQTETGGILISPLPGATKLKPGAATKPLFGIQPALFDENNQLITGSGNGKLAIAHPWPGQMRTIYGDHQRFLDNYLRQIPGYYFTGDGARRDEDGDYWLTGRIDDVLNVSGHRLGSAEIESAIVAHPAIAEAAVVSIPHPLKGEAIYAFITPLAGYVFDEKLANEIFSSVKQIVSAIAVPDILHLAPELPKTRSGKIMRRILRQIAIGDDTHLGDTSTLANPNVLQILLSQPIIKR